MTVQNDLLLKEIETTLALAWDVPRYRVKVDEYKSYWQNGYLVVRNLVLPKDVAALQAFSMDVLHGRVTVPGVPAPTTTELQELYKRFTRIHMLHRQLAPAERYLLYPRVLDVLEALIGPDVLALQTMLFLNPPGLGGPRLASGRLLHYHLSRNVDRCLDCA